MADRPTSSTSTFRSLVLIAVVVVALVAAFAFTAGWLSPGRLTPAKIVNALAPPGGPALGFRRNHAKGICFTGSFESNGAAAALSKAPMFAAGSYPVTGRFNLATADPKAPDATVRVRGLGLRIVAPDGSEWRSAMIDAPIFAVSTPQAFYALLKAAADKSDPDAMKNFIAAHPEFGAFAAWAGSAPWTASFAQEQYNSLNSFIFTNAEGQDQAVRWSFVPAAQPEAVTPDQLKARDDQRPFLRPALHPMRDVRGEEVGAELLQLIRRDGYRLCGRQEGPAHRLVLSRSIGEDEAIETVEAFLRVRTGPRRATCPRDKITELRMRGGKIFHRVRVALVG
jgi:catalase